MEITPSTGSLEFHLLSQGRFLLYWVVDVFDSTEAEQRVSAKKDIGVCFESVDYILKYKLRGVILALSPQFP